MQAIHPCYNDAVIIQPIYRCEIPQVISEVLKEITKNQNNKQKTKLPDLNNSISSVVEFHNIDFNLYEVRPVQLAVEFQETLQIQ